MTFRCFFTALEPRLYAKNLFFAGTKVGTPHMAVVARPTDHRIDMDAPHLEAKIIGGHDLHFAVTVHLLQAMSIFQELAVVVDVQEVARLVVALVVHPSEGVILGLDIVNVHDHHHVAVVAHGHHNSKEGVPGRRMAFQHDRGPHCHPKEVEKSPHLAHIANGRLQQNMADIMNQKEMVMVDVVIHLLESHLLDIHPKRATTNPENVPVHPLEHLLMHLEVPRPFPLADLHHQCTQIVWL